MSLRCIAPFLALLGTLGSSASFGHPGIARDIERLTRHIDEDPADADALLRRSALFRRAGDLLSAWTDVLRTVAVAPAHPRLALELGLTCAAMGAVGCAEHALDHFLRAGRATREAWTARARLHRGRGEHRRALAAYARALALGGPPDLWLERGRYQETLGRLAEAAAGYREGLAALGDSVVLRRALVSVELARGRPDRALAALEPLVRSAPEVSEWLLERARIRDIAGDASGARSDRVAALRAAERALALRPSAIHLVERARALLASGRRTAARRDLRAALRRAPRLAEAARLLAELER